MTRTAVAADDPDRPSVVLECGHRYYLRPDDLPGDVVRCEECPLEPVGPPRMAHPHRRIPR